MAISDIDATRKGEVETPSMRTDRLYRADGKWFIRTRESEDIGPYESYQEVTHTIQIFSDFARNLSAERIESLIENQNLKIEKRTLKDDGAKNSSKRLKKSDLKEGIHAIKKEWFYKTKKGRVLGPYSVRKEAEKVSALFKDFSKNMPEDRIIELIDKYIFDKK